MIRGNRPSIHQVGHVHRHGHQVVIHGWALGLCATACPCHKHPTTGHLVIAEDHTSGHLGLASYPPEGCDCCAPWTAEELAQVIRDLADITALQHQPPAAPHPT